MHFRYHNPLGTIGALSTIASLLTIGILDTIIVLETIGILDTMVFVATVNTMSIYHKYFLLIWDRQTWVIRNER